MGAGFDAEFVVAASQILDERVTADRDRCGPIRSPAVGARYSVVSAEQA